MTVGETVGLKVVGATVGESVGKTVGIEVVGETVGLDAVGEAVGEVVVSGGYLATTRRGPPALPHGTAAQRPHPSMIMQSWPPCCGSPAPQLVKRSETGALPCQKVCWFRLPLVQAQAPSVDASEPESHIPPVAPVAAVA